MAASAASDDDGKLGLTMKVAKAGVKLGKQYAERAKNEAVSDVYRIVISLFLMVSTVVFAVHGIFFMHVLVLAIGVELVGLRVFEAVALFVLFDFGLAFLLLTIAGTGLTRPIIPNTRRQVNELYEFLTD